MLRVVTAGLAVSNEVRELTVGAEGIQFALHLLERGRGRLNPPLSILDSLLNRLVLRRSLLTHLLLGLLDRPLMCFPGLGQEAHSRADVFDHRLQHAGRGGEHADEASDRCAGLVAISLCLSCSSRSSLDRSSSSAAAFAR